MSKFGSTEFLKGAALKGLGAPTLGAATLGALAPVINPGSLFGLIGSFFGGSKPDKQGAFNQSKYRDYSTERVSHEGDGTWRFNDPNLNRNFRFRQDDLDNFMIEDPETGRWQTHDRGDKYVTPIEQNLSLAQAKILMGGGRDTDFNPVPFSGMPGADPNKRTLPWQYMAMQSGPNFNPVRGPVPNPLFNYKPPTYETGSTIRSGDREYFMGKDGVWKPADTFSRETGKRFKR